MAGRSGRFQKILRPYDLKYGVKFKYLLKTIRFKAHKFAVNIGAKLGIAKYQEEKSGLKNIFKRSLIHLFH